MKVKFFIFAGLFILISFMSFSSASFEIGNQSHFFQENYKEGQEINSWINISFDSESVSSVFSDNIGNSQSLEDLLNSTKNSGYSFNCTSFGCVDAYSEVESFQTKSFQLGSEGEKIIGFKFVGVIEDILNAEFEIVSDSEKSCEGQLEVDFGDDGIVDFGNNKISSEICESRETKSCYDENKNPLEVNLNYNPYCQVFNLSAAPGFEAGLWVKEVSGGDRKISVELYDKYEVPQGDCEINLGQLSSSGDYVYCDIDYSVSEQGEYYVCVYSGNTGTGEYKTKGYYSSNSSEVCGFWDYPSQADEETNAYAISVKPKKFNNFGALNVNESSVSMGLTNMIEEKIFERYSTLDCSSGCYFPIRVKSNTNQNVTFRNLEIIYDGKVGQGLQENTFYELDKEGYNIDSDFQKIYLNNFSVSEGDDGNYSLYLEGNEIFSGEISFKDFGINLEISNYEKIVEGFNIEFYVDAFLNETITRYELTIDDTEVESIEPYFYHKFNETGNKTIFIEVETAEGEIFSESEVVEVYPIESELETLVENKRAKLNEIDNSLLELDPAVEEIIIAGLNLEESRIALEEVESSLSRASKKEDYYALIPKVESISFPFQIKTKSSIQNIFLPEEGNVAVDALEKKPISYDEEQDVIDYILYWNVQNLDISYTYDEVSSVDDLGNKIKSLRLINLEISEKESFSEDYYLYVKADSGLEILGREVEETNGYYILELGDVRRVQLLSESSMDIESLPVFIAPDVSGLEFSVGEVEEYDKSKNTIIMILLLFVVLLAGLVAYYFIGKWYDEKYERKLFPNRNDVFNLINYIARSKKNGVPESKIKKNLLNSQWSSEQVRFILRKYLGKNTGMYAFFKRKVKIERKIAKEEERKMTNERMQKKISSAKSGKIKERSVALVVILSIVTFGIYYFIWLLKSSKELKRLDRKAPSQGIIWASIGLVLIGTVLAIITGLNMDKYGPTEMPFTAIIMLVCVFLSAILMIVILYKYSSAHNEITGFSKFGLFVLLFLIAPVGVGIAQAQLNKVANKLQKT